MDLLDLRPKPKRKFDQFGVTEGTLKKRGKFLADRGFLTDSKILFLGDYDLTSLTCVPLVDNSEVWVLDIDADVLAVISEADKGIEIIQHNLTNPLPRRLRAAFDVVFTDPPYTPEGVSLFLSRSIEALNLKKDGRAILCYGTSDKAPERVLAIQEGILNHGLMIEEVIPNFNEYVKAKTIDNTSDLYVLRSTPKVRPLIRGRYEGKIYTFE